MDALEDTLTSTESLRPDILLIAEVLEELSRLFESNDADTAYEAILLNAPGRACALHTILHPLSSILREKRDVSVY